jgi:hypothetical protein
MAHKLRLSGERDENAIRQSQQQHPASVASKSSQRVLLLLVLLVTIQQCQGPLPGSLAAFVASSSSTSQQQLLCLSSASVAELLLEGEAKQQKNALPSSLGAKKCQPLVYTYISCFLPLHVPCGR